MKMEGRGDISANINIYLGFEELPRIQLNILFKTRFLEIGDNDTESSLPLSKPQPNHITTSSSIWVWHKGKNFAYSNQGLPPVLKWSLKVSVENIENLSTPPPCPAISPAGGRLYSTKNANFQIWDILLSILRLGLRFSDKTIFEWY